MARTPRAPPDGTARVGRAVASFLAVTPRQTLAAESGGEAPKISAPIPIFGLGAPEEQSSPATLLARTKFLGWRYLVFADQSAHVADLRQQKGAPQITRGSDLANRIVDAGHFAEEAVQDDGEYEARLLDLSLLGRTLLWMKSGDPAKPDRFFSLGRTPKELKPEALLDELSTAERVKAVGNKNPNPEAGG
jgi:hypothetical protein